MPRHRTPILQPDQTPPTPLGKWLADALVTSGISAYEAAKRSGVSHAAVSLILSGKSGKTRGSDRETVQRLGRATAPEGADEVSIQHHINRGLVANGDLPDSVPGGAIVILREGEPAIYRPGAPPDQITALRTGETAEVYRTSSSRRSGRQFVLTDNLLKRIEFEAQLEQGEDLPL